MKIREVYADNYQQIIESLAMKILTVIPSCNQETVHIPIESLTSLLKIDVDVTRDKLTPLLARPALELFDKFH